MSMQQKSKACSRCRQHKAKCVGGIPCRRCTETGVDCTPQIRAVAQPLPDRVAKLEADVARLKSLLRAGSSSSEPDVKDERHDRVERIEDDEDITLIDSVRLGKRSRRRSFINGEIRVEVAFENFVQRASHFFPFIDPDMSIESVSQTSLFFWAMIAVGAREGDELSATFELARKRVMGLTVETLYGQATLSDLRGLLIVFMWLDHIRIPGHAIGIAHELNLRGKVDKLATMAAPGNKYDSEHTENLRVYSYLFLVDRLASMLSGRPRLLPPGNLASQIRYLLNRPNRRIGDIRIVAQIESQMIIGHAQDDFFPDNGTIRGAASRVPEYDARIDGWFNSWINFVDHYGMRLANTPLDVINLKTFKDSLFFMCYALKFHVNIFALRGVTASEATVVQLTQLNACIRLAREVCEIGVKRYSGPAINALSNFAQLQMSYAAIFLARVLRIVPATYEEGAHSAARAMADLLASSAAGRYYGERIDDMLSRVGNSSTPTGSSQSGTHAALWTDEFGLESQSFWDWVQHQDLSMVGNQVGQVGLAGHHLVSGTIPVTAPGPGPGPQTGGLPHLVRGSTTTATTVASAAAGLVGNGITGVSTAPSTYGRA